MTTRTLDLGCGPRIQNPFGADELYGVDVREDLESNVFKADLVTDTIPFANNFFDFVTALDFLEHIPRLIYLPRRRLPFVELMNEIHRVLKVDGLFLSYTPAYPHAATFADPTHVNIITEHTFQAYFVQGWAGGYGWNGNFSMIEQKWVGPHLQTILRKTANVKLADKS